jgi:3-methyladenine DNA glycosylase AlkD
MPRAANARLSTPEAEARRARREIARRARPAGEFDFSRYFRGSEDLGFYNAGTRSVRDVAKAVYRTHRDRWSVHDALRFASALMVDRHLEVKAVGIELLAAYRRDFRPALLPVWKRWLRKGYAANWATTDEVCGSLIGPLLLQHPALARSFAGWSRDRHLWVRRASAVGLIALVRRGIALDIGYEIATSLRGDREDLIQKAAGWMLREAGKSDPGRLERYLRSGGPQIPRTTLRYAIERFPPATRRRLLTDTRKASGTSRVIRHAIVG